METKNDFRCPQKITQKEKVEGEHTNNVHGSSAHNISIYF